jgi:hypothetical protein
VLRSFQTHGPLAYRDRNCRVFVRFRAPLLESDILVRINELYHFLVFSKEHLLAV